ncbi:hypothetical protein ACSLPG_37000, partial [Escherichia coli]
SYVLTNDDLEYRHKVSPYVGRTIGARITKTILRGDVIYDIEHHVHAALQTGDTTPCFHDVASFHFRRAW